MAEALKVNTARLGRFLGARRGDRSLSELVDEEGLGVSHLSKIERGVSKDMSVGTLVRLASTYETPLLVLVDQLIEGLNVEDVLRLLDARPELSDQLASARGWRQTVAVEARMPPAVEKHLVEGNATLAALVEEVAGLRQSTTSILYDLQILHDRELRLELTPEPELEVEADELSASAGPSARR